MIRDWDCTFCDGGVSVLGTRWDLQTEVETHLKWHDEELVHELDTALTRRGEN